jgi:octaprenyl-diphosphate synthase
MPAFLPTSRESEALQECLGGAIARVDARLRAQLKSDLPPVQRLLDHVERYHGKMVRPYVAILSGLAADARLADADPASIRVSDAHVTVAGVCELIHLATLVHDDVLDDADTRRQSPTVNALRGNEAAVILGDYLFSAAYHLCSQLDSQETALDIAQVGMTLCAGELLQLHHRENFSLDEATYYTIVERKTASLIAAACRLGARHAGADPAFADRFGRFGMSIGVAFQIQDDLLDLTGDQAVVGKSLGKDLEKGKLTLPLIHHLATATPTDRARTLALLADAAGSGGSPSAAQRRGTAMAAALRSTGSINHARTTAERFVADAKGALAPLHDSPAKRLMLSMADAVVSRDF